MRSYYTRVCNFYYGDESRLLVKSNRSIPLNGNKNISFDHIEIISRTSKKKNSISKTNSLTKSLKKLVNLDLIKIRSKKKKFSKNFSKFSEVISVNLRKKQFRNVQ